MDKLLTLVKNDMQLSNAVTEFIVDSLRGLSVSIELVYPRYNIKLRGFLHRWGDNIRLTATVEKLDATYVYNEMFFIVPEECIESGVATLLHNVYDFTATKQSMPIATLRNLLQSKRIAEINVIHIVQELISSKSVEEHYVRYVYNVEEKPHHSALVCATGESVNTYLFYRKTTLEDKTFKVYDYSDKRAFDVMEGFKLKTIDEIVNQMLEAVSIQ